MRNEETLKRLEDELQQNCGDMLSAAKSLGVSAFFVEQWRKDDKQVHERLREAERVGIQGLVSAAIQRGVHGVEEDIYYKGEVVGQKRNYSDSLLTTLLKAKVPEFAKDGEGGGGVTINIANVMPRANSYQEWLEMKQTTLAPPLAQIEDATFEEVVNPFEGIEL